MTSCTIKRQCMYGKLMFCQNGYLDNFMLFSIFQYDQLVLLEGQINQKINSNDPGTDVGYWESLLQQLKAHMARVRIEFETLIYI